MARTQMAKRQADAAPAYSLAKRKYQVFCLLNRLHISKATWDAILTSSFYNRIRKNHSFD